MPTYAEGLSRENWVYSGGTSAYQYGATSGYRTQGDAGLTLVGCRYYDAQVGRFITRDTYQDQKPYAYCDGDPVNQVDPTGHNWAGKVFRAIMILFGAVEAGVGVIVVIVGIQILPAGFWPGAGVIVAGLVLVALGATIIYAGNQLWNAP